MFPLSEAKDGLQRPETAKRERDGKKWREAKIKDGIGRKRESRCSERTMDGERET